MIDPISLLIFALATGQTTPISFLPDNAFYNVKVWVENIQEIITTDPYAKSQLMLNHAQERLDEIKILGNSKNLIGINKAKAFYNQKLVDIDNFGKSQSAPPLANQVRGYITTQLNSISKNFGTYTNNLKAKQTNLQKTPILKDVKAKIITIKQNIKNAVASKLAGQPIKLPSIMFKSSQKTR